MILSATITVRRAIEGNFICRAANTQIVIGQLTVIVEALQDLDSITFAKHRIGPQRKTKVR